MGRCTGRLAHHRGCDIRDSSRDAGGLGDTPYVARKQRSAIDRRAIRHEGYRRSQRARKRAEAIFGWVKTVAGDRQLRCRE